MPTRHWPLATLALTLLFFPSLSPAHPTLISTAVIKAAPDGALTISATHDALAFALNDLSARVDDEQMEALVHGPREDLVLALTQGRDRFAATFHLAAGGAPVPVRLTSAPTADDVLRWMHSGISPLLPVKLEFAAAAHLPPGPVRDIALTVRFPEIMGDVILTLDRPGDEPLVTLVRQAEESEKLTLRVGTPQPAEPTTPVAPAPPPPPAHSASFVGAWSFVVLGFEHIVDIQWARDLGAFIGGGGRAPFPARFPEGLDHVLFVLGLFFLSPRIKPLLIQITTFTVAHSITLALAARGTVHIPPGIVEPAIAASIAFVAAENLFTQKVHPWRPLVVFAFGLIHGLGFASVFADAMGGSGVTPIGPVLFFNLGVELGQLAVVGAALLLLGWCREKNWYRPWISIPASVLIALTGLYWTVQRIFW